MAGRDEAAVVGELAVDEARHQVHPTELEGRVALAEAHGDLLGPAQEAPQLAQRRRRHQHVLALFEERRPGEVAHGEAVGVGGHQAQPVALGRHVDAGEDRPALLGAGGDDDLAEGIGQGRARQGDAVALGLVEAGELRGGDGAHRELAAAGGDRGLVVVDRHLDPTRLQDPHDLAGQLGRQHGDAVGVAGHLDRGGDGQVEVAAGEAQLGAPQLEPDARQHGEGATPAGDRAPSGPDGLGEHISLTAELHDVALAFFFCVVLIFASR